MKSETIRKNIVSNNWEHYVENNTVNGWAQGITGNEQFIIINTENDVTKYSPNNDLLIYESIDYSPESFTLQTQNETRQTKAFTDLNKGYVKKLNENLNSQNNQELFDVNN